MEDNLELKLAQAIAEDLRKQLQLAWEALCWHAGVDNPQEALEEYRVHKSITEERGEEEGLF